MEAVMNSDLEITFLWAAPPLSQLAPNPLLHWLNHQAGAPRAQILQELQI
jgi:hypothetical protein